MASIYAPLHACYVGPTGLHRRKLNEGASLPSEDDVMDEAVTEEVLLDENKLAERSQSYSLGGFEVCGPASWLCLLP